MDTYDGHRPRESLLQSKAHLDTGLLALSDELITKILAHLELHELARVHLVSRRFNRLLSWPDPSLKPYGSVTFNLDSKFGLLPCLLDRYVLKRAAGFTRVCLHSFSALSAEHENWILMHKFLAVSLPQLAAVFTKFGVQLELVILEGGHILFPDPDPDAGQEEGEELTLSEQFSADYWEVMSPVLTNLVLWIGGEIYLDNMHWVCSMQKLQRLELRGRYDMDRPRPALFLPPNLSLPALKVLRLEGFSDSWHSCHLDCPSLETLHLRDIEIIMLPTGLGSCSRLTTLDIAAAKDAAPSADANAGLLAANGSAQNTLECLDMSGWSLALNVVSEVISRLPRLHTLVAQRNGLTAVPTIPAPLRSLDLRANEFTEVPPQLESLTQLTFLALSSRESSANFQIRRPLDAIISLPHLKKWNLVLDCSGHRPEYAIWNVRSLFYLGLAKYEIARSKSGLVLIF